MASWISVAAFVVFVGVLSLVTAVAREAVAIRREKTRTATRVLNELRTGAVSTTTTGAKMGVYPPSGKDDRIAEAKG